MLLVEFNRDRMMQFGVSTFRAKEFGVLQPGFLMALGVTPLMEDQQKLQEICEMGQSSKWNTQ